MDWKRKLSSRKFWLAIIGFVTAILIYLNVDAGTIERTTSLIMAGGTFIAYIVAEGMADTAGASLNANNDEEYIEAESTDEDPVTDEELDEDI